MPVSMCSTRMTSSLVQAPRRAVAAPMGRRRMVAVASVHWSLIPNQIDQKTSETKDIKESIDLNFSPKEGKENKLVLSNKKGEQFSTLPVSTPFTLDVAGSQDDNTLQVTLVESGTPISVNGDALDKGKSLSVQPGAVINFGDVSYRVIRDERAHA